MKVDEEKKPWRVTVGVTVEREVLDMIKQRAKESDRSISRYINWVLREHLRNTDNS